MTQQRNNSQSDPLSVLTDTFGRFHNNLRISITDRCNLRCTYCMPEDNVNYLDRAEILSYEEIVKFIRVVSKLGVNKIRLTGGEPLVRQNVHELIAQINQIEAVKDFGLTTNGILLENLAEDLYKAGLRRINVSMDTLSEETFKKLTRREGLDKVIAGIKKAKEVGFDPIKINALSMRGITEDTLVDLANFSRETGIEVRFIEFMPLDADNEWERDKVFFASEIIESLSKEIMPLLPVQTEKTSPSTSYEFEDGIGKIGIIASVSRPFCENCNRFRLTADGKLRNCLFSMEETDIKSALRNPQFNEEELLDQIRSSIQSKNAGHAINTAQFIQPDRPMNSIGG
jgi:GTP 3',8-cyclase